MLKVENVCLRLNKKDILQDICMEMIPGQIYGLVGNNGCGKTMLMKVICGLIVPTSGRVTVDGVEVGEDADYLPNTGIIIETPGFLPYYSGRKNLRLLAGIRGKISKDEIDKYMRIVGLEPESRLPVRKYSLGMRQRLGIAQALMEGQKILILDEPMNGLDKSGVADVRRLLLEKREEECLIILASHNREDIEVLCDTVYEMDAGRIVSVR